MKRLRLVLVLLTALGLSTASNARAQDLPGLLQLLGQAAELSGQASSAAGVQTPRQLALTILGKYSPDGLYLIESYENCPAKYAFGVKLDFMEFVQGTKPVEIATDLNTAVHEVCHAYSYQMVPLLLEQRGQRPAMGAEYSACYMGGEETILVRHTPVFATREMESSFPERLRTFRFKTYVYPSEPDLGSQVNGVYGLLGELIAYYHGTRTAVQLYQYYRSELEQTPENWFTYFANVNGTYYAYLEFKLYVLKYVQWARDRHIEVHRGIVSNSEFDEVFTRIDRSFHDLMQEYFVIKEEVKESLRAMGYRVEEDDEYLWIGQGVKLVGQSSQFRTYRMLAAELSKPEYQETIALLSKY